MEKPTHVLELEAIVSRYNLKYKEEFLAHVKSTPRGFCFMQSMLRGGCMAGFFLGMLVPFLLWIYPGTFSAPWHVTLCIVVGMTLGWLALLDDLLRQITLIVEPGGIIIERRWLGLRIRRHFPLGLGQLEVYRKPIAPSVPARFGLRIAGHARGFPLFLRYDEAEVLRSLIDFTVSSKPVSLDHTSASP